MSDSQRTAEIQAAAITAILPKNEAELVQVSRSEYRGRQVVNIRVFADYSGQGQLLPTRKGICFRLEQLPQIIEALESLRADAIRNGLLTEE